MNLLRICIMFLCVAYAVFFTGCGSEKSISLQEVLLVSEQAQTSFADTTEDAQTDKQSYESPQIVVYVCGEVCSPGVYELTEGSRVVAAVEAAGGFTEQAAREAINLAELLRDGEQISVPNLETVSQIARERALQESGLVNLNQATVQELCTLPGIGEAKAKMIIQYRETHGLFQSTKDIQLVSGISEKIYLQIKDKIYIE